MAFSKHRDQEPILVTLRKQRARLIERNWPKGEYRPVKEEVIASVQNAAAKHSTVVQPDATVVKRRKPK